MRRVFRLGYGGVAKHRNVIGAGHGGRWNVTMMAGKRRALLLVKGSPEGRLLEELEHVEIRIRAKVEHLFRVIKQQWGHAEVRFWRLVKNTAQFMTLLVLVNLRAARRKILKPS